MSALLFFLHAHAGNTVNVIGSGNDSCGKWLKSRKTQTEWHQAGQWINGYYVAAQEFLLERKINLKRVDTYGLISFVDQYCTEKPLDTIYDAMIPLLGNLVTKSQ